MALRRLRPITRDLVVTVRGVPDDPAAHVWGLGHGDLLPAWAEASLNAWGMIGVSLRNPDGVCFLLVTPGEALPTGHPMRRIPRAPGAAVVIAAYAPSSIPGRDAHSSQYGWQPKRDLSTRRHGAGAAPHGQFHSAPVGRQLASFLAGRLQGSVPAIEAGGTERRCTDLRVAPAAWLEDLGFRLVDPLDAAPVRRMQLDLRHTVPAENLGHRIWGWVRGWSPESAPEPSSAQTCRAHRSERISSR